MNKRGEGEVGGRGGEVRGEMKRERGMLENEGSIPVSSGVGQQSDASF